MIVLKKMAGAGLVLCAFVGAVASAGSASAAEAQVNRTFTFENEIGNGVQLEVVSVITDRNVWVTPMPKVGDRLNVMAQWQLANNGKTEVRYRGETPHGTLEFSVRMRAGEVLSTAECREFEGTARGKYTCTKPSGIRHLVIGAV